MQGLGARRYLALVRIDGYGSAVFDLDLRSGSAPELEWTVPEGRELSVRVEETEGVRWSLYALRDRTVPVVQADGIGTCARTMRLAPGPHRLVLESEQDAVEASLGRRQQQALAGFRLEGRSLDELPCLRRERTGDGAERRLGDEGDGRCRDAGRDVKNWMHAAFYTRMDRLAPRPAACWRRTSRQLTRH